MVMLVFWGVHQLPIPFTGLYKARLGSTITLQQLTIGGACDFDRTKKVLNLRSSTGILSGWPYKVGPYQL